MSGSSSTEVRIRVPFLRKSVLVENPPPKKLVKGHLAGGPSNFDHSSRKTWLARPQCIGAKTTLRRAPDATLGDIERTASGLQLSKTNHWVCPFRGGPKWFGFPFLLNPHRVPSKHTLTLTLTLTPTLTPTLTLTLTLILAPTLTLTLTLALTLALALTLTPTHTHTLTPTHTHTIGKCRLRRPLANLRMQILWRSISQNPSSPPKVTLESKQELQNRDAPEQASAG